MDEAYRILKEMFELIRDERRTAANTATRIGNAFLALLDYLRAYDQSLDEKFLHANEDDIARGVITFLKGAKFGNFEPGLEKSGAQIDAEGNTEVETLIVRALASLAELIVSGDSAFGGSLSSEDFISGFLDGQGWGIQKKTVENAAGQEETRYAAEFDEVTVRGVLRVFELVISQLLGENDNRVFTGMMEVDHYDQAEGKVYLDTKGGKLYNPFRRGDYIEVQQFNGLPSEGNDFTVVKSYELIINDAGVGNLADGENRLDWVTFEDFESVSGTDAASAIRKGDTFCRVDNKTNPDRKGIVEVMTVGPNTPYIDVVYGLKTDPDNALKGRLGNLSGIRHHLFGWLKGFGEYLINLYAVGDFRLRRTGESLDTKIEMLKGVFSTQFQKQSFDMTEDDNYLTNATFTENMKGWTLDNDENTAILAYTDGTPLVLNGSVVSTGSKRANVEDYDGKQMLHLMATGVSQLNSMVRKPGTHKEYALPAAGSTDTTDSAVDVQDTLYLSIRMLPKTSGKLTVGFRYAGTVPQGKTNTLPYTQDMDISKSQEWQVLQWSGTWHGLGDFYLHFTGEMYVALLSLTDKPLDELKSSISTQIVQTAENIRLLGTNISKNGAAITQLGVDLDAVDKAIRLYVNTQYYTKSQIDVTVNGITTSVVGINDTLDAMSLDLDDLQSQIDVIDGDIDELQEGVAASASYISQTKDKIAAVVANFDANGNVTAASGIVTTAVGNRLWATTSSVDTLSGRVSTAESNINVLSDQISLRVEKDGIISAINQSAESVKINASKILLEGYTTINNSFSVDVDGTTTMGGFKVAGNGLTNVVSGIGNSNMAYIICRNDYYGRFAGIGANVLPATAGESSAVGRFENTDSHGWYSTNICLYLEAKNGERNYAFVGSGNGVLNGLVAGYKYNQLTCQKDMLTELPLKDGNVITYTCSVDNSGLALPTIQNVRLALGIGSSTYFTLQLIVIQTGGTSGSRVYGKNAIVRDSSNIYWMNDSKYPQIKSNSNGDMDYIDMAPGDCLHFALVYNGSYNAYIVGHRD